MEIVHHDNRYLYYLERFGNWFTGCIIRNSAIIVSAIILLPLAGICIEIALRYSGMIAEANLIKTVYSYNCHQIESRCPEILGSQLIVCFRCLGFYFGAVVGWFLAAFTGMYIRKITFLLLISVGVNFVDIIGIGLGLWDWPGVIRLVLAFPAGLAPAYLVMRGILKIKKQYRN
jgi:uncharacterized membrane protein